MQLTEKDLSKLCGKAAFLKERINNKSFSEDESEKRYQLWKKKAGGSGKAVAFLKRLEAENITIEQAKGISGEIESRHSDDSWCRDINKIFNLFPFNEEDLKHKLLINFEKQIQFLRNTIKSEKRFSEAKENMFSILPFVFYAENELMRRMSNRKELLSNNALSDMSRILATGLLTLVNKVISDKLRIFILRNESFGYLMSMTDEDNIKYMSLYTKELLSGGWKDIFLEFPVLPRIMITVINNWINNMDEFACHLTDDINIIEKELNKGESLGKVKSIKGSISDSHNKGKGVIIVEFESGFKSVYKPRNLGIDKAYEKLIFALKEMNFPYDLKAPIALEFKDHGWIEFIEYKELNSIDEATEYYKKAGALLCLVYTLGGNDFHGENIIACGGDPILIDLETIIAYKMIQFNEEYEGREEAQEFVDIIQESVIGLGFLPIWISAIDFGALTGAIKTSIPSFNNEHVKVFDYVNDLLEGFDKAYDFFMKNKSIFYEDVFKDIFNRALIRIILRPTNVYAKMLHHTLKPQFLKDGFLYSIEIERLAPAYLIKVPEEKVKKVWDMFLYERDALEDRDIPIFYGFSDKKDILSNEGIIVEDFFQDSIIERVYKKLMKLNVNDKNRQLDFIKECLSIYNNGCHYIGDKVEYKNNNHSIDEQTLLIEAKNIYKDIMKKSIKLGDEGFSWISYQHDLINNKTLIGQTTAALYDGVFGIALFTSALYSLTSDEGIKKDTLLMVKPFRDNLRNEEYKMPVYRMDSGLGNGLGGIVKSLIMIGDYLKDKLIHEDVIYLINKITKEQISNDKHINVMNGIAGLMEGLMLSYKKFGHEYSLELANICGSNILKNMEKIKESGFAYGRSGIIYSLINLYNITEDAWLYEQIINIADSIDLFKDSNENTSFCLGITGVAIASIEIESFKSEKQKTEEIIEKVMDIPMNYGDHLCCGNMGKIDFITETSIKLDRPELIQEVNKNINLIIERKNATGHYNIMGVNSTAVSNPSLFQGLSGIGYEILRSINPDKIKSILY